MEGSLVRLLIFGLAIVLAAVFLLLQVRQNDKRTQAMEQLALELASTAVGIGRR